MNKIEYTENPKTSDINFLTKQINQETSKYGEAYPFAFFIKNDGSQIIAGANGFFIYGSIYTDQLWVDKEFRRQGLATKIMNKVHDFGKLEGCEFATIQTMSFQGAQLFYEKLGYAQDFKRAGYVSGSNCIFMKRAL